MKIFVLFFLVAVSALGADGWPAVAYTEVRAYHYEPQRGDDPILVEGKLHPTVVNKDGAILEAPQTKRLIAAITGNVGYGHAKCYFPRHAFIFYDDVKKPVAVIEVCLACCQERIEPRPAGFTDFGAIADLLEELKLPLGGGFTDAKSYRESRAEAREVFDTGEAK